MQEKLTDMYGRLHDHFGPQNWWPGESSFEVILGAVLTQNTNWKNVQLAINILKGVDLLTFDKLSSLPVSLLAEYIRPAGYYNIKAGRLHNLFALIREIYNGSIEEMLADRTDQLRANLLSVKGIGPETADSILLYAAERPVFVVDAYTHRVLTRHDLIYEDFDYDEIQQFVMDAIEPETSLYNEFHALIVCVGKEYCKKSNPLCDGCPLEGL